MQIFVFTFLFLSASLMAEEKQYIDGQYGATNAVFDHVAAKKGVSSGGTRIDSLQELDIAQNYVHEGLSERTKEEECDKLEDSKACRGKGETSFLGMSGDTVSMIAKAYGTILGMIPGNGTVKLRESAALKKGKKTKSDICKWVAVGTEMISTMQQQAAQNSLTEIPSAEETKQRVELEKAAQSHEDRSNNSKTLATGWGATAACYTYQLTMGGAAFSWGMALKLAGAALLTKFYLSEVDQHLEYAKQIRDIAYKLPLPGDCDPIEETSCYCKQPETMNDANYCAKEIKERQEEVAKKIANCIDQDLKEDPKCKCRATKSCIDKRFTQFVSGSVGKAFLGSPQANDFGILANGQLASGALGRANLAATNAIRNLKRFSKKPRIQTNKSIRRQALKLEEKGIPLAVGERLMAKKLSDSDKMKLAKMQENLGRSIPFATKHPKQAAPTAKLKFKKGYQKRRVKEEGSAFSLSGLRQPSEKGDKVVEGFEMDMPDDMEIEMDEEKSLFEIISVRYQLSGVKILGGGE